VKISPPIANPILPAQPERRPVAVEAPRPAGDAVEDPGRRTAGREVVDDALRARLAARAEVLATPQYGASAQARRAMLSYAQVAGQGERDSLRDMLGFDDYA
jgi:hypothetical protein